MVAEHDWLLRALLRDQDFREILSDCFLDLHLNVLFLGIVVRLLLHLFFPIFVLGVFRS